MSNDIVSKFKCGLLLLEMKWNVVIADIKQMYGIFSLIINILLAVC